MPQGWTLVNAIDDPYFGAPYDEGGSRVWPIVLPMAGGKMHMMPAMSQFHRRLAVVKAGFEQRSLSHVKEEGLAFVRPGSAMTRHSVAISQMLMAGLLVASRSRCRR